MTSTQLTWIEPDAVLAMLGTLPHIAFLDSGGPVSERSRWSIICIHPREVLYSSTSEGWTKLRGMLRAPQHPTPTEVPFSGGVIGLASYEAGLALEGLTPRFSARIPHLTAYAFDGALIFDRERKTLQWVSDQGAPLPEVIITGGAAQPLKQPPQVDFLPDMDQARFQSAVDATRQRIARGDLFQANVTCRFMGRLPHNPDIINLYRNLRMSSPAPYGALFRSPDYSLLGASVERFISLGPNGWVETRPIKGTAPLGDTPEQNAEIAASLARNEKEYGENLMITDLMRNDIGRVCDIGSVSVPTLCQVERFAHVHHLVSSIRGKLSGGKDAVDLLKASLPPGSVSGAPKHAALRLINTLERSSREAYCGSLFWIGNNGRMDSNVIIRSALIMGRDIAIGAGGGITYPSDSAREYEEMRLKAAPLLKLFQQ